MLITRRRRPCAHGPSNRRANNPSTALTLRRSAASCPNNLEASPSALGESTSRSNSRNRNCRHKTRNCSLFMRSRLDQIRNLAGNRGGVLFHGELPEDLFQRRAFHKRPKSVDGIVGNNLPPMQNNHSLADALHRF